MTITVKNFVEDFKNKNIKNTVGNPNAVAEYIDKTLEVKKYLPFNTKREIVEIIVRKNITVLNGVKVVDTVSQYVSFVVAMLKAHTNLELSSDPIDDYDLLSESGLLVPIIEMFKQSYDECDILLKMTLETELADNNANMLFGKFLNVILDRLDDVVFAIENAIEGTDINGIIKELLSKDDIAKLSSFLHKYEK